MKVFENEDSRILRSPDYNYNFNKLDGFFARWGKTSKDDPQFSPFGPEIADIEITTICEMGCQYCFVPETQIKLLDEIKNIEDVKVGDKVLSKNIDYNKIVVNEVLEVYKNHYDGIIINIEMEDGTILRITPEHPVYVKNVGWVEAQYLTEDMEIETI